MKKITILAIALYLFSTSHVFASMDNYPKGPSIVNGKELVTADDVKNLTLEEVKKEVSEHPNKYSKISFLFGDCAIFNNNEKILQFLIDKLDEDLSFKHEYINWIFNDVVSTTNNLKIVKMLVKLGAKVDGDALLNSLSNKNNLDIARYLIEAGADVTVKDKYGTTALGYLISTKVDAPDIVQKLIDGGIDVNAYDLKNPLEYAHVCGLKETEKLLIKAGAKPEDSFERLKKIGMDCEKYSSYSRSSIFSDPPSDSYTKRYWFW